MAAIINLPSSPKVSAPADKSQQPQASASGVNEGFSQALSQQIEKKQTGTEKPTETAVSQTDSENNDVNQQVKSESSETATAQKSTGEAAQAEPDISSSAESSQQAAVPVDTVMTEVQQPSLQELLGLALASGNAEGGKELPLMAKLVESSAPGASIAEVMAARNSSVKLAGTNLSSTDKVQAPAMDKHALLALQQQLAAVNKTDASAGELKLALQGVETALQSLSRAQGEHSELKGLEQAREQLLARLQGLQGQNAQSGGGSSTDQQGNSSKLAFMQKMDSEDGGKLSELSKLTKVAFQEMMAQQQPAQASGVGSLIAGPSISMNSLTAMLSPAGGANPLLNYATSSSSLNIPVNHPAWGQAVGERLQWMVKQDVQQAQLKLNPRNMGPIEIKIAMNQEQATVTFVANHAMTREALDAAVPRLREMFGESGLNLVDVNVSQNPDTSGQRAGDESGMGRNRQMASDSAEDELSVQDPSLTSSHGQTWYGSNSVLDAYA